MILPGNLPTKDLLCVTSSGLFLAKSSCKKSPLSIPLSLSLSLSFPPSLSLSLSLSLPNSEMRFLALNRADAPCFCTQRVFKYTLIAVNYGKFTVFRTQTLDIFENLYGPPRPTEPQNPPSNKKRNSQNPKIFENPLFPQSKWIFPQR